MPHHAIQLKRSDLQATPPAMRQAEAEATPNCLDQMPGDSEWYVWHGQRIHYRVAGSGPPVVLVHAIDTGASCYEWRSNLEPLSKTFAPFAVDLPGFGRSDVRSQPYRADLY